LRSKLKARKTRAVQVAIATIMLAVPASAFALTGTVTDTQAAATPSLVHAGVTPRRTNLYHAVTVTGAAPASDAGHSAVLETSSGRQASWHFVTSTPIGSAGRFRLRTRLRHSGFVRVIDAASPSSAGTVSPSWASSPAGTTASSPVRVAVAAQFKVRPRSWNVLDGHPAVVQGRLMPARAGRQVRLQAHYRNGWRTVASDRTGQAGGFRLRYAATSGLQRRLRVLFAGDSANMHSSRAAGQLTAYGESVASWYNDAGNTACGFHAGLGVANRSLPCGTKVRFRYNGRSVTATVDDRGPFVGGRDWDLNQNTAQALGFDGVGTVWTSQ
jgi:rare lipoprotein A